MKHLIILLSLTFSININAQQTIAYVSHSEMNEKLKTYEALYTKNSVQYADCVLWCAMQCALSNDNKQARNLLKYSDRIFDLYGRGIFNGRDTISEILRYDVYSKIEQNLDRDYYAIKYAKRSLFLKQKYFGLESEQTLNADLDLSQLYAARQKYQKASKYHNDGYNGYVELLKREFCSSSESKRMAYWKVASQYVGKTLTEALKFSNNNTSATSTMSSSAYNACLLSKGILLNTTIDFENYVINSTSKEANRLLKERKLSSDLIIQDSLDYLMLDVLKKEGKEYHIPQLSIVWQDVAQKLTNNDVAIEFFRTPMKEYGAIVVKKGWNAPKIIKLKNQIKNGNKYLTLDNALKLYIDKQEDPDNQKSILWELSRAIWTDKLLMILSEEVDAKVYFSADGLLQLLNLESLPFNNPNDSNHAIMSDIYNLYRLSSTRLLAIEIKGNRNEGNATLYGDILYNVEDSIMKKESDRYSITRGQVRRIRGAANNIMPLTHTKKEVSSIASTLKQNDNLLVEILTQSKGNEESFKSLSGLNQKILHIATHGFYDQDDSSISDSEEAQFSIDSSMQRTGLLLAGSQKAMCDEEIPDGVEDGILTAYEISHVNLNNLEIAVLSACETALGDVTKDGVAGLQRGFKQAGAKSLIMSLWKVDDEATCALMTEFYSNWIEKSMSKHDAFEAAKKTIRETPKWRSPKYWAAFILLDGLD